MSFQANAFDSMLHTWASNIINELSHRFDTSFTGIRKTLLLRVVANVLYESSCTHPIGKYGTTPWLHICCSASSVALSSEYLIHSEELLFTYLVGDACASAIVSEIFRDLFQQSINKLLQFFARELNIPPLELWKEISKVCQDTFSFTERNALLHLCVSA